MDAGELFAVEMPCQELVLVLRVIQLGVGVRVLHWHGVQLWRRMGQRAVPGLVRAEEPEEDRD
jgi:hypothetical protein